MKLQIVFIQDKLSKNLIRDLCLAFFTFHRIAFVFFASEHVRKVLCQLKVTEIIKVLLVMDTRSLREQTNALFLNNRMNQFALKEEA